MNFSEMKLQVINGVNSYFNRNWNRDDMMNLDEIPDEVQRRLTKVYVFLFYAMASATAGSYFQWFPVAGGEFRVFSYVASLTWYYFTPPERENTRFFLSMLAAYSFGASFGFYSNDLFKIEQRYVIRLLAATAIGIGNFLYRAIITTERSEIYNGYLQYCFFLIIIGIASVLMEGYTALWTIIVILFIGYLVIYSQEVLYHANLGDIDFVNCTFTVFLHLPGIVIHAARLYLQGPEIEQHKQNSELIE